MASEKYMDNRKWSDRYLDDAARILSASGYNCDVACDAIDMKEAGDFLAIDGYGRELTVAFRVRAIAYAGRYMDQFTLRFRHANGSRTEYKKIKLGYGDLMLYGFGNDAGELEKYVLLDLVPVRHRMQQIGESILRREIWNKGKTTSLVYFKFNELPAQALIDSNYLRAADMWTQEQVDWLDEYIRASA